MEKNDEIIIAWLCFDCKQKTWV